MAAVGLFVGGTLPPAARVFERPLPPTVRFGAYHVHTARSDGTGSADEVAAAAARAGLHFVVLTDHGDGTRPPDPPAYRHGVLLIDAVEVSTDDGHLVALGLFDAAPYPLAGAARDVVEDIQRLGGQAVIAHPESAKPELRWRGRSMPVDGFEWVNVDSEWRDDSSLRLLGAALRGLVRGPESVASLFRRDGRPFARWDGAGRSPRMHRAFGVAALDAHARIGWQEDEAGEPGPRAALPVPGYELMFRVLAQAVELDEPLTGTAGEDARRVLGAMTSGRTYTVVGAIGWPAVLEFTAEQGDEHIPMGGSADAGRLTLRAEVPGVDDAEVRILRNGEPVASGRGRIEHVDVAADGVTFRAEATLGNPSFPWIVSNPVYSGSDAPDIAGPSGSEAARPEVQPIPAGADWAIERDASSSADYRTDARGAIVWRFALGPGRPAGQFAALSLPVDGAAGYESIRFDARASRPMRLSVQVRLPGTADGQRWGRSVYVDERPRTIVVRLEDLVPIGHTTTLRPVVSRIRSLLLVIDTVNTLPGSGGEVELSRVGLALGQSGAVR